MTSPAAIAAALACYRFSILDEGHLQVGLAAILDEKGIRYDREHQLDRAGRIDFLTEDGIGIEVKVAGTTVDVHRQLCRYAASPAVTRLMLVTTRALHRRLPDMVGGVQLVIAPLRSLL